MKAARLHAFGDLDQFNYEDAPMPVAAAGEVLIKIEAASLNPVDLYIRQGYLQQVFPLTFPAVIGIDAAGTVAEVGAGIVGVAVGDRVVAKLDINGKGALAEYSTATINQLAKLPTNIDFPAAAALPLAGLTGRQAVDALNVKPGDRVLVSGALGAVGRVAVQYLKELGAVPVAGVRAERLAEGRTVAGEALAIGSDSGSFALAIDTIGGPLAAAVADLVQAGGTLAAVAGVPDGTNADNRITISNIQGAEHAPTLQRVVDAAGKGELIIPVARTFKLSEVSNAYGALAAGEAHGKIVLVP